MANKRQLSGDDGDDGDPRKRRHTNIEEQQRIKAIEKCIRNRDLPGLKYIIDKIVDDGDVRSYRYYSFATDEEEEKERYDYERMRGQALRSDDLFDFLTGLHYESDYGKINSIMLATILGFDDILDKLVQNYLIMVEDYEIEESFPVFVTNTGNNALHLCALQENDSDEFVRIAKRLTSFMYDWGNSHQINSMNSEGKTPLDLAIGRVAKHIRRVGGMKSSEFECFVKEAPPPVLNTFHRMDHNEGSKTWKYHYIDGDYEFVVDIHYGAFNYYDAGVQMKHRDQEEYEWMGIEIWYGWLGGNSIYIKNVFLKEKKGKGLCTKSVGYTIKALLDLVNSKGMFAPEAYVNIQSSDACAAFNCYNRACLANGYTLDKGMKEAFMGDYSLMKYKSGAVDVDITFTNKDQAAKQKAKDQVAKQKAKDQAAKMSLDTSLRLLRF